MTNVLFKFPVFRANEHVEIERKYCELMRDYRNGVFLDPEAIDWMDSANVHLIILSRKNLLD